MATSYAYVNPVVAVVVGVAFAGEVLTGPEFLAMPLILTGVALVTLGSRPAVKKPAPVPATTGGGRSRLSDDGAHVG